MKIAITGMVGSGKSTALKELEHLGWRVVSADELAREVARSEEGRAFLQKHFGDVPTRQELRERFLSDAAFRRVWEGFVHPRVNAAWQGALAGSPQANWAVEVPLLYEKELESHFDKVVVCVCSPTWALARWVQGKRSPQDYEAFSNLLMPPQEKISRADFVLKNDDSAPNFLERVRELHLELIK